jgi:hypothetical protein
VQMQSSYSHGLPNSGKPKSLPIIGCNALFLKDKL